MMFSPKSPWLLAVLGVAALGALGCEPGGVGDPCIPEDEYHPDFGGYGATEANDETKSFQCITRVCLVNHFRGRASCPYGQAAGDIPPLDAEGRPSGPTPCTIPGTDGSDPNDRIIQPVAPQYVDRQTDQAVYCSCRCDGPDPNARDCDGPSGVSCEERGPDLGVGTGQLAGSYCVKDGTQYDPKNPPSGDCSVGLENCGAPP